MDSKICLYLQADGYVVNGVFECRELAFAFPGRFTKYGSYHFKLTSLPVSSHEENLAQDTFDKLHGLPALGGTMYSMMVEFVIADLCGQFRSKKRPYVAIRGNEHLAKILHGLRIKYIDLEALGCPPFELLKERNKTLSCGKHAKNMRCGQAMVMAYKNWMMENH